MYGIFTYIWVIFGANVGKYSIHGASGDGWVVDVITTCGPQLIHAHPALDKFPPNIRQYLR